MATKIYDELSKVAGVTPNKGEEKTAFLVRMVEGVAAIDDNKFDALSEEAQKWFNTAAEAINAKAPDKIPTLSGLPKLEKAGATEEAESPAAEEGKSTSGDEDEATSTKKGANVSKKTTGAKAGSKKGTPATAAKTTTNKTEAKTAAKKPAAAAAKPADDTKFSVKKADAAKRGFVKDCVEKAQKLGTFTREEFVKAVKSKDCDEARAKHYFYWMTSHGILAKAK